MPEYVKPPNEVFALDNANFGKCLAPCRQKMMGFPLRDVVSVYVVPHTPITLRT
jgi:hypothetical protein